MTLSMVYVCLDGPEENSSKLLSMPFVEDPQQRLKWTAYLEFTHNDEVGDLTWDKVCIHAHLSFFLYCLFETLIIMHVHNGFCMRYSENFVFEIFNCILCSLLCSNYCYL